MSVTTTYELVSPELTERLMKSDAWNCGGEPQLTSAVDPDGPSSPDGRRCCLLFALSLFVFQQSSALERAEQLALVRSALLARNQEIISGRGNGTLRNYYPDVGLETDATFFMVFDHDKYRLDIKCLPVNGKQPRYDRYLVVYDGTAVLANRFSERIKPSGCEADVLEMKGGVVARATRGIWSIPPNLFNQMSASSTVIDYDFALEELDNGQLRGTCTELPDKEIEFTADPVLGFNVVSYDVRQRTDYGTAWVAKTTTAWERSNHVWFITSYRQEDTEDGEFFSRREIVFEEFEANPVVEPTEFDLDKAALCGNSRIIDRRPEATVKIHKVPSPPASTEQQLQSIAETVEQMPAQLIEESPVGTSKSDLRFRVIMFAILTVLCATASWFLWQRR